MLTRPTVLRPMVVVVLAMQVKIGRWTCTAKECQRVVEFDGSLCGLFSWRRRNKKKQWLVFTRGLLDKLYSFIVNARTTYTAATRHLAADLECFNIRRQDVVKLGTAALQTYVIPPETARCPICGPNPSFIVIDAQAIGCTDANDVHAYRPGEDCPVLPIENTKLCILESAALRGAVEKVLRTPKPLTAPQIRLLSMWRERAMGSRHLTVEGAAATVFFRFFPLGEEAKAVVAPAGKAKVRAAMPDGSSAGVNLPANIAESDHDADEPTGSVRDAVRLDEDGRLTLGGPGKKPVKLAETWRDRVGTCAPDFARYDRDNDGVWQSVMPFLRAMLAETATGMFHSHDERAVQLFADSLRFQDSDKWREVTKAADGVGFVASFIGMMDDELEADEQYRLSVGMLLRKAVDVEKEVDDEFESQASSLTVLEKGWKNGRYCKQWGGRPTPAEFTKWRRENPAYNKADIDDPYISYEFFPSLPRVRPALKDSVAASRRAKYRGKKRHAADVEGDGDACNKAFSITAGLTQGVFNVVCPHVITLGFRVLFRAESVGEALSIVLERFPTLPSVIFYDVACKIDKNAMRRVRPIMRSHNVRCILDRPHSITHSCSPIYMPDQSLGSTAGVATQAAEVSHSISVGNRTSLAYMAPATYITHRIVQVAFMNIRKLYRLHADNSSGENDHIPLAPFFHHHLSSQCQVGMSCSCEASLASTAEDLLDHEDTEHQPSVNVDVSGDPPVAASVGGSAHVGCAVLQSASTSGGVRDNPGGDESPSEHPIHIAAASGSVASEIDPVVAVSSDSDMDAVGDSGGQDWCPPPRVGALLSAEKKRDALSEEHIAFLRELSAADRPGVESVRPGNHAKITLTVADYRALSDNHWLNDAVMNSYIELLNRRDDQLRAEHERKRAQDCVPPSPPYGGARVMSTFFFDRLWSEHQGYNYACVSRWALKAGVDLKTVGQVLIPVNLNRVHWVLIAVDLHRREFIFCDPYGSADQSGAVRHVRRWLRDEAVQQLGADAVAEWAIEDWQEMVGSSLPKQVDSSSCGVFTLMAASVLAVGATCRHTQDDMPDLRRRLAIDLYLDEILWSALDVVPVQSIIE